MVGNPPHGLRISTNRNTRGAAVRINAYLEVGADDVGSPVIRCTCCEATLGPATKSYKNYSLEARRHLADLGAHYAPPSGETRFEIREYYCPSCLVLLDTDVALKGDPVVDDAEPMAPARK
jgi:acetone carboxylase gamma subunit